MGYSPWSHNESDMTEPLTHTHTHTHTDWDQVHMADWDVSTKGSSEGEEVDQIG